MKAYKSTYPEKPTGGTVGTTLEALGAAVNDFSAGKAASIVDDAIINLSSEGYDFTPDVIAQKFPLFDPFLDIIQTLQNNGMVLFQAAGNFDSNLSKLTPQRYANGNYGIVVVGSANIKETVPELEQDRGLRHSHLVRGIQRRSHCSV
jgi:hypothetical protein